MDAATHIHIKGAREHNLQNLELRIPRVLRYPVPGVKRRTALRVCEYMDGSTGAVLHYRLAGVEER